MNDGNDQLDLPQVSDQAYKTTSSQSMPTLSLPQNDQVAQPGQQQAVVGSMPVPEEANELDLIEKEWVLKAKQIVEHTYDDPYVQQAEISKMKADYMKKRYNKDIKIAESR